MSAAAQLEFPAESAEISETALPIADAAGSYSTLRLYTYISVYSRASHRADTSSARPVLVEREARAVELMYLLILYILTWHESLDRVLP